MTISSNVKWRLLVIAIICLVVNFLIIVSSKADHVELDRYDRYVLYGRFKAKNNSSKSNNSTWTPVVMWHGMGDTAHGSIKVLQDALESTYEGMHVHSIQIGNNAVEDAISTYFFNANEQVEIACRQILNNQIIIKHGSVNAIGFSQGGQFMRALIQRCPLADHSITVKNFISIGGQHQGVYGLPHCAEDNEICKYARHLVETVVYDKVVQEHVVQAEYWQDPFNHDMYLSSNVFLTDINNEHTINEKYRTNLMKLENMILVMFNDDQIMVPKESAHFEFYKLGQNKLIEKLQDSKLYTEDRLGLKQLDESKRLKLISIPGGHLQFKVRWFMKNIASKYLEN